MDSFEKCKSRACKGAGVQSLFADIESQVGCDTHHLYNQHCLLCSHFSFVLPFPNKLSKTLRKTVSSPHHPLQGCLLTECLPPLLARQLK